MATRTNIIPNPSFEYGNNFWNYDSDYLYVSTGGYIGPHCITQNSTSGYANFYYTDFSSGSSVGIPVTPGQTYIISFWYMMTIGSGSLGTHFQVNKGANAFDLNITDVQLNAAASWTRYTQTFVPDAGVTSIYIRFYNNNGVVTASYDNFMIEATSSVGNYFDGDSTQSGFNYFWTGTQGLSPSIESTASTNTPAVFQNVPQGSMFFA